MGSRGSVAGPGLFIDLRADIDVRVIISNCPQINNPCNGYNPTPIQIQVWSD